jgi:hypothetical protein
MLWYISKTHVRNFLHRKLALRRHAMQLICIFSAEHLQSSSIFTSGWLFEGYQILDVFPVLSVNPPAPHPPSPQRPYREQRHTKVGTGGSSSQRMLQEPMDVSPGRRRGNSSQDIACDRCGTSKCWIYVVFYDLTGFYMAWYCFYIVLKYHVEMIRTSITGLRYNIL